MAKKQQEQLKLLKRYKSVVGSIVTCFRNLTTRKYITESVTYDAATGRAISLLSYSYPNRDAWKEDLQRFPRERNKISKYYKR